VPDDSLTVRQRAIAAWPPAWHGQDLRDILVSLGCDVDRPFRDLPRKDHLLPLGKRDLASIAPHDGAVLSVARNQAAWK